MASSGIFRAGAFMFAIHRVTSAIEFILNSYADSEVADVDEAVRATSGKRSSHERNLRYGDDATALSDGQNALTLGQSPTREDELHHEQLSTAHRSPLRVCRALADFV